MSAYKRILVAVDGSAPSNEALAAALDTVSNSSAQLRLVHFIDDLPFLTNFATGEVFEQMRRAGERVLAVAAGVAGVAGIAAETHLVERVDERLGDCIANQAKAWGADLIVLGTHGRHGLARLLLGSGAEQIIRLAPVPVLVIRADGE